MEPTLIIPTSYLTKEKYIEHVYGTDRQTSDRSLKRWLAAGEMPGARKDERGRWLIPADAVHTINAGELVPMPNMTQAMAQVTTTVRDDDLKDCPSFLTITQAAHLLGLPEGTVRSKANRRYFRVRKLGGRLLMPLSRVKKLRGLIP